MDGSGGAGVKGEDKDIRLDVNAACSRAASASA